MKMLTIKNNIVGNGFKPSQMENHNDGIAVVENDNVGNGLKSFQIGNHNDGILIVENNNVGNADLRSLREKLKRITNQTVI